MLMLMDLAPWLLKKEGNEHKQQSVIYDFHSLLNHAFLKIHYSKADYFYQQDLSQGQDSSPDSALPIT